MVMQKSLQALGNIGSRTCVTMTMAVIFGFCANANAFEIETGNEDLSIHLDNTLRYTLAQRLKDRSDQIVNSVNNDDGDRNFGPGLVSSRFDLLSEFDAVYK
jgi:hypothetical protein